MNFWTQQSNSTSLKIVLVRVRSTHFELKFIWEHRRGWAKVAAGGRASGGFARRPRSGGLGVGGARGGARGRYWRTHAGSAARARSALTSRSRRLRAARLELTPTRVSRAPSGSRSKLALTHDLWSSTKYTTSLIHIITHIFALLLFIIKCTWNVLTVFPSIFCLVFKDTKLFTHVYVNENYSYLLVQFFI